MEVLIIHPCYSLTRLLLLLSLQATFGNVLKLVSRLLSGIFFLFLCISCSASSELLSQMAVNQGDVVSDHLYNLFLTSASSSCQPAWAGSITRLFGTAQCNRKHTAGADYTGMITVSLMVLLKISPISAPIISLDGINGSRA